MVVAIAGGHGKIGLRLTRLLAERGDRVLSIIRKPEQAEHVAAADAEAVVLDLEDTNADELARAIGEADAVVFAAGAGPGSGAERKRTMDLGGAVLLIDAAKQAGIRRYVMVSAMRANPDHPGDEVFDVYLRAKGQADAELAGSGLDYTIVRPGGLTDEPARDRIAVGERLERGEISRDDVAAVLAATLAEPATIGRAFDLVAGDERVETALAGLAGRARP